MKKLIAAAAAVGLLVTGFAVAAPAQAATKTLTLGVLQDQSGWDPGVLGNGNNSTFWQATYDTLFQLDEDGNVKSNVATKYAYDKTFTKLTITIRPGIKFTDGTALDAAAVAKNLLNTKKGTGEAASFLTSVIGARAVNKTTVLVTLSQPDPGLLLQLASQSGALASPKAIAAGTINTVPVGSGPYVLDDANTVKGSRYTFVRNPKYWNKKQYEADVVVLKVMSGLTAMVNALAAGEVQAGNVNDAKQVPPLLSKGLNVQQFATSDVAGLYLWDRTGSMFKPLGDVRVRQALNYAVDRQTIWAKAALGVGYPTAQVFAKGGNAYLPSLDTYYKYDVAKAKSLLADAGYPNGFEFTLPDVRASFPSIAAALQEYFAAVGVKVTWKARPALAQYLLDLQAGKWAAAYMPLNSGAPFTTVAKEVETTGTWNMFKYQDATMGALIKKARATTGAAQVAALRAINTQMVKDAWNVPLTGVISQFVYSNSLEIKFAPYAGMPPLRWIDVK